MAFFIERVPEQLRVVIVTREEPPFPLARWRVSQRITEIDSDDLRFSHDESMQFLEQTMGLKLDPELAQTLESRTEGWIAGLQMAALSVQQHARSDRVDIADKITTFNGEHHYVIDYLATEVVRQQPEAIRSFLRKTAILDRLSRAAVRCGLGARGQQRHPGAPRAGQHVSASGSTTSAQWFRYHQLFADFLRAGLDATAKRDLHGKASAWHEAHGSGQDAIRHALAADDVPAAVRLFRSQVESMLARGEIADAPRLAGCASGKYDPRPRRPRRLQGMASVSSRQNRRGAVVFAGDDGVDPADAHPARREMLLVFQAFLAIQWGETADVKLFARQALDELATARRSSAPTH